MTVPVVPLFGEEKQHRLVLATTLNETLKGRDNSVSSFTLAASTVNTVVTDNLFLAEMMPVWTPTSANAAAAMTNLYVSARTTGSFTLTHTSTATVDRSFLYARRG